MLDLVPRPGIEPRRRALVAWSLSHWTTGEVPKLFFLSSFFKTKQNKKLPFLLNMKLIYEQIEAGAGPLIKSCLDV